MKNKNKLLLLFAFILLICLLSNWQELKRGFVAGYSPEATLKNK